MLERQSQQMRKYLETEAYCGHCIKNCRPGSRTVTKTKRAIYSKEAGMKI